MIIITRVILPMILIAVVAFLLGCSNRAGIVTDFMFITITIFMIVIIAILAFPLLLLLLVLLSLIFFVLA